MEYKIVTPNILKEILEEKKYSHVAVFSKIPKNPQGLISKLKKGTLSVSELKELKEFYVKELFVRVPKKGVDSFLILGERCQVDNQNNPSKINLILNYGVKNGVINKNSQFSRTYHNFAIMPKTFNYEAQEPVTENIYAKMPKTHNELAKDAKTHNEWAMKPMTYNDSGAKTYNLHSFNPKTFNEFRSSKTFNDYSIFPEEHLEVVQNAICEFFGQNLSPKYKEIFVQVNKSWFTKAPTLKSWSERIKDFLS